MDSFKDIYQKAPAEMDEGEYRIAIFGYLHGFQEGLDAINKRLDVTNGKVKAIPEIQSNIKTHNFQIGWLWGVVGLIGGGIALAFIKYLCGF